MVTTWQSHNAIIEVNPNVDVVLLRFAIDVIWVERGIGPAFLWLSAGEPFEDNAAAHWYHIGGAPSTIVLYVRYWEVGFLWE